MKIKADEKSMGVGKQDKQTRVVSLRLTEGEHAMLLAIKQQFDCTTRAVMVKAISLLQKKVTGATDRLNWEAHRALSKAKKRLRTEEEAKADADLSKECDLIIASITSPVPEADDRLEEAFMAFEQNNLR